ncbi:hypothetical protein Tel_05165 [Candidatus Tenderia electrophaga]|jgi:hypothetical protein|uniref:Zinc-regulated TonB-dependent outer membrane receptor n=1 Tax=Candidatus Tenderia electrophaga TaxID=1748243 RepID=A0A0S2TBP4_9GAMM|nr:hypothetical protein Tel_05165 [Candidatus Tenderia electrophaga]
MYKYAFSAALCCVSLSAVAASNQFNPAISLILEGQYAAYDQDPENYELPGFMLGGESELVPEGFAMGHNELVLDANIDDRYYGKFTLAFAEHEGEMVTEVEEAYVETLGLPAGLSVRAGRFYSGIGYLNSHHRHAWDFSDAPLVYRGMLGGQVIDDGVQLRWLAPTPLFLQLGVEKTRGERFPAGGAANDGSGASAAFIKLGGDLGTSHSWQLGLSRWQAEVIDRDSGAHAHGGATEVPSFSGDSDISGIDFVWKWAPDGNPTQRNFKFQAEYFERDEDGTVVLEGSDPLETTTYQGEQSGWYMQGVYQFMPRWRVGLRHDRLRADNRGVDADVLAEAGLDDERHTPRRSSVMVDYSHSEYSRIQLQYNQDDSSSVADDQVFLYYVMSLGAHGAHRF